MSASLACSRDYSSVVATSGHLDCSSVYTYIIIIATFRKFLLSIDERPITFFLAYKSHLNKLFKNTFRLAIFVKNSLLSLYHSRDHNYSNLLYSDGFGSLTS